MLSAALLGLFRELAVKHHGHRIRVEEDRAFEARSLWQRSHKPDHSNRFQRLLLVLANRDVSTIPSHAQRATSFPSTRAGRPVMASVSPPRPIEPLTTRHDAPVCRCVGCWLNIDPEGPTHG